MTYSLGIMSGQVYLEITVFSRALTSGGKKLNLECLIATRL